MIVVDSHVLVYASIDGGFTEIARRVEEVDNVWVAPPLWRSEFRNVLAGNIRRGHLTLAAARDALTRAELSLEDEPGPDSTDVLALVATSRCTAYDLEYVAIAQSLGIKLVTNDRQILDSFPTIAVSLESFAAESA